MKLSELFAVLFDAYLILPSKGRNDLWIKLFVAPFSHVIYAASDEKMNSEWVTADSLQCWSLTSTWMSHLMGFCEVFLVQGSQGCCKNLQEMYQRSWPGVRNLIYNNHTFKCEGQWNHEDYSSCFGVNFLTLNVKTWSLQVFSVWLQCFCKYWNIL